MNWRHRAALGCAALSLVTAGTVGLSSPEAQAAACGGSTYLDSNYVQHVDWHNCLTVTVYKRGGIQYGPSGAYVMGPCVAVPGGATRTLETHPGPSLPWKVTIC